MTGSLLQTVPEEVVIGELRFAREDVDGGSFFSIERVTGVSCLRAIFKGGDVELLIWAEAEGGDLRLPVIEDGFLFGTEAAVLLILDMTDS